MLSQISFKNNLIFKRIFFSIMMIIMFYIIFGFSSQNGETSGRISLNVTKFIVDHLLFRNFDNVTRWQYINTLHPIIRKLAHFSIYTLLGFSVMGFWCTFDIKDRYKFLWSTLIGVFYAFGDEFHQSFIAGRGASIVDVCIDSAGVITGIFIITLLIILFEKLKNKVKK